MNEFDEGQPRNTRVVDGAATSEPLNHGFIIQQMGMEHII